jgi:signal transduction histidine kinase
MTDLGTVADQSVGRPDPDTFDLPVDPVVAAEPVALPLDGDGPTTSGSSSTQRLRTRLSRFGGLEAEPAIVASGLADDVDRLAPFRPAVLAIRWATVLVSIVLAAPDIMDGGRAIILWLLALVALGVYRTRRPLHYTDDTASLMDLLAEAGFVAIAVHATGSWSSPLVFTLLVPVIAAGFARGFGFGFRIAITVSASVLLPDLLDGSYLPADVDLAMQWVVMLLLVSVVAGYGRRISGEANRQHSVALARLSRLSDANALLFSLHRVAQTLPASFDLDEVLDTTVQRLKDLLTFDAITILLLDDTEHRWIVVRGEGARLPPSLQTEDLPPPLLTVLSEPQVVRCTDLAQPGGPGLVPTMGSGLYAPLQARGSIVGLVAIEHRQTKHFDDRDGELVGGFVEPAALAIDNARWFSRLRTVGADEERTRIARDLHDRIGQSLAYLAFELDRLVKAEKRGQELGPSLDRLRGDVRGVIGEVRDTLYDLRTDVSDAVTLVDVLEDFTVRVTERCGLEVELQADRRRRPALLQERELWRIAQEALMNVERHANATRARVVWRCDGDSALLEILDDGEGFPPGVAGRLDSYGILGMRERASSIGATLEVLTAPGKGTRVRCLLQQSEE